MNQQLELFGEEEYGRPLEGKKIAINGSFVAFGDKKKGEYYSFQKKHIDPFINDLGLEIVPMDKLSDDVDYILMAPIHTDEYDEILEEFLMTGHNPKLLYQKDFEELKKLLS